MTRLEWLEAHKHWTSDQCLPWPFSKTRKGYPSVMDRLPFKTAHRWMCAQMNGPPPLNKQIATHSCGNGHLGCVNPRHLRWGDHKSNGADMIAHGRSLRGAKNWKNKLSADTVHRLRQEYATGEKSVAEIARDFGISAGTVVSVCRKNSWHWLHSPSQQMAVVPRKKRISKRGEIATKIMSYADRGLGPTAIARNVGCSTTYVASVLRRPDLYGSLADTHDKHVLPDILAGD